MSCSQFIEHEDEDKNDTLVIIVNGDGTVTVDPLTLERVLSQQSKPAVSVIRFENNNEPDSQTENVLIEKNEKAIEDGEKLCRKVNLIIEGYYPSAAMNAADRIIATESMVSSTVSTPPLPTRNSSEFLDLLSEELEIPVSQSPTQSNLHAGAGDGGIGDSLVDAFSEMAPEQLKRVETALHSEKAKQILGDDVTCVLDTLKLNDDHDDWVHLDHCYTNIYGSKKQNQAERIPNVVVQDSEMATMLTIKVGTNEDCRISSKKEIDDVPNSRGDSLELTMPENVEVINVPLPADVNTAEKDVKNNIVSQCRAKLITGNKVVPLKGSLSHHVPNFSMKNDRSSAAPVVSQKPKRKSKENSSRNESAIPERIVTEDEVDGVKVFKPTRNDKRNNKSSMFLSKDLSSAMKMQPQLIQSKLNFVKKLDSTISSAEHQLSDKGSIEDSLAKSNEHSKDPLVAKNVQLKKENARKTPTPITSDIFGPALFSTPDIIRKINSDGGGSAGEMSAMYSKNDVIASNVDEQTADIEKRMSALENGEATEAILDQMHLQVLMQTEMERITSQADDDKLLSDLENSADEEQMDMNATASSPSPLMKSYNFETNIDLDLDLDLDDSEHENQRSMRPKTNDFNKSEGGEKNEGECEDDPNKLWCLCNKPHNNRFMICCDACDNWFHGKCVGISKAIGEKMEQDGTEWLCPSCRKEKFAKERENKLKLPPTKSTASRLANRHGRSELVSIGVSETYENAASTLSVNTAARGNDEQALRRKSISSNCEKTSASVCIECKGKEAMPNAVYCSAQCVSTYVVNSLHNMNSGQRIPLSEDRKIIMIDRKSGHQISGLRAPVVGELKEWLLQNPSYEVERPSALPTCRPNYASTFTKPAPKKLVNPLMKSKEVLGTTAAVGVAKPYSSRTVQMMKSLKTTHEIEAKDGNTQISMKQYVVKRSSVEVACSGEGSVREQSAASVKKDDFKLKDKQRQIKIIPVQPLPPKPIEEHKDKSGSSNTKKLQVVSVAPNVTGNGPPVTTPTSSAAVSSTGTIHALPEKKKKPSETLKKTEPKRTEPRKKETTGTGETSSTSTVTVSNSDMIRANVRKVFNELFVTKMKDSSDIKLSDEEVSSLASCVEEEIFMLHNKDIGSKYKNKYRQLLFNIKQPQNTLFRRFALEKSLSPYELVRLTPDEMACTELAEWRQREAKHEIDMIKKTELENLQQSKVLVLKTHKGELEIESEPLPPCKPDLIVPDLQPEDVPEGKDKCNVKKTLPYYFGKEKERGGVSDGKDDLSNKKACNEEATGTVAFKEKHRKRHDHKDRRKSSKSHHRSSEREREKRGNVSRKRSRSGHRRSSKSPNKERRRSGSPSSHRSRSVEKAGANEKDSRIRRSSGSRTSPSRNKSKKARSPSTSRRRKDRSSERKNDDDGGGGGNISRDRDRVAKTNNESASASSVTNSVAFDVGDVETKEDEITADLLNPFKSVDVDLSDMEPTSTVTIKTPPYVRSPSESTSYIWKGTIVMPDVVRFNVGLKQVSGNCEGLDDDLHSGVDSVVGRIDCVGRIDPAIVWDYIGKVKKSGNKDILVLRFESVETDDQNCYLSFYSYLNTKNRMAVVGNTGTAIKDFYVMPLASHSPIPQVLLPLDGPGFEDSRPHLLLAVVVRSRRRRYHHDHHHSYHHHYHQQQKHHHFQHSVASSTSSSSIISRSSASLTSMQSSSQLEQEPYVPPLLSHLPSQQQQQQSDSFTPPHSPTSVFIQTPRVPVTATVARNEEDEPYSPKDEDDNDVGGDDGRGDGDVNREENIDDGGDDGNDNVAPFDDEGNGDVDEYDDADEPYSPSALDEQQCKSADDDIDNCSIEYSKPNESADSFGFVTNEGDRVELYSPSEHFFNDIESSEITLPATLKNLLNRVKNRTSEPISVDDVEVGGGTAGTILEVDPIVDAYKKSVVDESDEDIDDAIFEENPYTPPLGVINIDDDEDDDDNNNNNNNNDDDHDNGNDDGDDDDDDDDDDDGDGDGDDDDDDDDGNGGGYNKDKDKDNDNNIDVNTDAETGGYDDQDKHINANENRDDRCSKEDVNRVNFKKTEENSDRQVSFKNAIGNENEEIKATGHVEFMATAELAEDIKSNRDPRRKTTAVAATIISQPPPPGMEDEFSAMPSVTKPDAINPMLGSTGMTDAGYSTQMPYAYAPPYAAIMPQPAPSPMYLATAAIYPQTAATLPYAAISAATPTAAPPPPPQIYVPPPPPPSVMLRTDPSLIPLPIDTPDSKRTCEKRKLNNENDEDSNDDRKSTSFKTFKKHKPYYASDSKSNEMKSSPNRHRSSSYESHRRGYQRDDFESGSSTGGSSRYAHKYSGGGGSGGSSSGGNSSSSSRSYRDRGGYWKSGNDYSSSSHKRYSRNSSGERDRSGSSKRNRWDSSKYEHDDRDCDSKKDRDKCGDHSRKSESSRRS